MIHLQRVLALFGLTVKRTKWLNRVSESGAQRASMSGFMRHLKSMPLKIETVIDVGAAHGTMPLYEAYPDCTHLLIEPLAEFGDSLRAICASLRDGHVIHAAVGRSLGTISLNVHPDLYGSSLYIEGEKSGVNGDPRIVELLTLDAIAHSKGTRGKCLIKLDVQGAELDVLQGAQSVLSETECVIMETSLFHFFQGGPLIYDCMQFMLDHGFALYDVFDHQYRLLDNALSQIDLAFVRAAGDLRREHVYASTEQRAELTKRLNDRIQRKQGKS